jgi:hypothetical protein
MRATPRQALAATRVPGFATFSYDPFAFIRSSPECSSGCDHDRRACASRACALRPGAASFGSVGVEP